MIVGRVCRERELDNVASKILEIGGEICRPIEKLVHRHITNQGQDRNLSCTLQQDNPIT